MKNIIVLFLLLLTNWGLIAQPCGFDKMHNDLMKKDPAYKAKVEAMNRDWIKKNDPKLAGLITQTSYGTEYQIPVVVHVIHTGGAVGTTYNPSDATIQATIDYLNQSFAATYSGYVDTNNGGVRFPIKFVLAKRDPNCNTTTGINRVDGSGVANYTLRGVNAVNSSGVPEATVKALSRWNNKNYYNIWVVNKIDSNDGTFGTFIAGYAYFPGASYTLDGTIMLATQMTAGAVTLPHEMGHAFGLYHTFEGDGTGSTCPTNTSCSTDGDLICDTEPHKRNLGTCASGTTNTCVSATYSDNAAKNIMNYCTCPNRFTSGQRTRFINTLLSSRKGLLSSMALLATGTNLTAASCSTTTTNALHAANMGPIAVTLNDLQNNTSGAYTDGNNYFDFSCTNRANLIQGQTYTLTVATYLNAQNMSVWIDYNNDGAFTVSERIANFGYVTYGTAADTDWHTLSYTVPSSGVTTCTPLRMRVMSDFGGASALPTTGCGTLAYGQTEDYSVTIRPASAAVTATIEGTNPICTGGGKGVYVVTPSTSLTSPSYQWYKNSQPVGTNSATYSATSGLAAGNVIQCKINFTGGCSSNPDSVFSNALGLRGVTDTNTWTGQTSSSMATTSNWSCGSLPSATTTAYLPKSSLMVNTPSGSSGTYTAKNLWIDDYGTLALSSGVTISVKEVLTLDSATITGAGRIILNGTSGQTITGAATISNLELNNSAGATINSGTGISITDTYTPTSGTLTTNGGLLLKSTSSATARIAAGATGGGYISGNITMERYIPGGRRAFRFFSHPFNASIALSQLTDDINITGSGGATNGFTTSGSNNPSSFWFNVTAGDNSTTGNNPGWTAFTNTNGAGANAWSQYGAARILVRGALGEGLTSGAYTPSAVTLDMAGVVNQGNTTVSLTKGSGTNFILVGNPFASQVNMDAVSRTNVGSAFYIWDANQGVRGGYTSYSYGSSSFNLPSCGAFVTTLSANGSMIFEEADKSSSTPGTMFKTTGATNTVELRLEDSTTFWDRLLLKFDDNAMATLDYYDASKLYNPDITFNTISKDDSMLSIDSRPYVENEIIPLGFYSTLQKNFKIVATNFDMPLGTKLFLHDKFLNNIEEITGTGYEYLFTVTTDTASWGNNRFELNTMGKPTTGTIAATTAKKLKVKLVPNPTTDNVTIYYEGVIDGNISITVTNMVGLKVAVTEHPSNNSGSITIPMQNMATGMYIVEIRTGNETITQKLIKQ